MTKHRYFRWMPLLLCLILGSAGGVAAQAQGTYSQSRIDIGLVVSDLEKSVAFYQEVLGLQRAYSFDVATDFAREAGLTAGPPLHAVALKLTADRDAPVLKLVQTGTPKVSRPKYITDQSGVRYLTVNLTALGPVLERLKQHNIPVLGNGPVRMNDRQSLALVQDPDGVFLELIGPMQAPATR